MRTLFLSIGILSVTFLQAQYNSDLMSGFRDSDWIITSDAKDKIENKADEYMAELINMMKSDSLVKLENTGDLIYPGAERFYGHGKMIDYEIDNLSIRAGWLLEEITFKNFGFSGIHVHPSKLVPFIKNTYPNYYIANTGELEGMSEEQLRDVIHRNSIKEAQKWWDKNKNTWTRIDCLVKSLESFDDVEQVKALSYLRNGTTKCPGLTNAFYKEKLFKTVDNLKSSDIKRISEQANLILDDITLSWLNIKGNN